MDIAATIMQYRASPAARNALGKAKLRGQVRGEAIQ
jgi:hypothetical protein